MREAPWPWEVAMSAHIRQRTGRLGLGAGVALALKKRVPGLGMQ